MKQAPWFGHLLFNAARLLGRLPLPWLQTLGATMGRLMVAVNSRETHIARRNLGLIQPELSDSTRAQNLKALMRSTGQGVLETLAIWTRPRPKVLALVQEVQGEPHLNQALSQGRGVILAVPHYGNWELLIAYMAARGPFSLVYRVPAKAGMAVFLNRARSGENVRLVPAEASAMRPLLRALQNGEVIGITPDQQPRLGGGEFVHFFGRPALTLSLIAKLAQRADAPVLFAFSERMGDGFRIVFEPEESRLHNPDLQIALQAMNDRVQAIAERDFRQYQWTYKRFSIRQDPLHVKNPYR
jgi:Kdo2-lipid IVA lauroyltransferase/acyltransferase